MKEKCTLFASTFVSYYFVRFDSLGSTSQLAETVFAQSIQEQ